MLTKKGLSAISTALDAPETGVGTISYDRNTDILTVVASAPARDFGVAVKTYHLHLDQGYFRARYERADGTVASRFARMFPGNDGVHPDIAGEDTARKPADDLAVFENVMETCEKTGQYPCFIDIVCPTPSVHPSGILKDFVWEDGKTRTEKPTDTKTAEEFIEDLQKVLPDGVFLLAAWLEEGRAGIEWCTRETFDFQPPTPFWVKGTSVRIYEEDRSAGTKTLTTYDYGDKNVREHGKGHLRDFFSPWNPDSPAHCLYRLLTEYYGILPEGTESIQVYWEDPGTPHPDDNWSLAEDVTTPDPLNQRVCLYEKDSGGRRVYTRTDLDDVCGNLDICQVYLDFAGFVGGPTGRDLEFPDTPENRTKFLQCLVEAERQTRTGGGDDTAFRSILTEQVQTTIGAFRNNG